MSLCIGSSDNFCSHPDKHLKDHLREVGCSAKKNIMETGRTDLSQFAFLAGLLHDIGKYTEKFQKHLRTGKKISCSDHAFVSSLIAFGEARSLSFPDEVSSYVYPLLIMDAVMSHHGWLKGLTVLYDLLRKKEDELDAGDSCLIEQINDLGDKWDGVILPELSYELKVRPSLDLFKEAEKTVYNVRNEVNNLVKENKFSWKWYFDGLVIFSSLIDADKHSASGTGYRREPSLDFKLLIEYASTLPNSGKVFPMRKELFSFATNYSPDSSFVFLNAPTGSGKTISGTIMGLKHSKRRFIYSLPFINIIEQTYNVLHKVYGESVMKFHHLSYPDIIESDDYTDMEQKLITAESWDSPAIVTTFEALVSTIFSNKNAYLKRLHNLANSFLLLDEIQAMGIEELYIIKEALEEAVRNLNINVLFMTATNPFWEGIRPVNYNPNRYKIIFHNLNETVTPEDFAAYACEKEDVMVEFNTIASAERGFNVLQKCVDGNLYYLSTRVIPKQRMERVNEIAKKKNKGEKVVLVTTQLVEAGVDLDFVEAMRDLGPIDSIIQAAGRVNRNWNRDMGNLTIMRIKRDMVTDFSLIYGKLTEEITLNALTNINKIEEKDINNLLSNYYNVLRKKFKPEKSMKRQELLKNITCLEFNNVDLKLIKEEPKYPVFIILDKNAERIYNEIKATLKIKSYEKRTKIKVLMAEAENYLVKVWEEPQLERDEKLGWYIVKNDEVEKYYDHNKGLKGRNEEALIW